MEHFLAERYLGRASFESLGRDAQRIRSAAAQLEHVELLQSLHVAADETCFYLFASDSAELVDRAADLAGVQVGRVLPVSLVLPLKTDNDGSTL